MGTFINFNGTILAADSAFLNRSNRALRYGDALHESIRVVNTKLFYWEEHYLRLMASMRILRMEIPMNFTMEFLEEEILKSIAANNLEQHAVAVRFTVFRNDGMSIKPLTNDVSYFIEAEQLEDSFYTLRDDAYEVELFKDFYVNVDMLSNINTNNNLIQTLGSIYATENDYDDCLLLNANKQVIAALDGNIFLVKGKQITTAPLEDGCINGILRKQLIAIVEKIDDYEIVEASISPFDLQKVDEIFITNAIFGIQSITKYRKKSFEQIVAKDLLAKLNAAARLA